MDNINAEVPFSTIVFCSVDGKFISSSYVFFMNYTNGFDFEKKVFSRIETESVSYVQIFI